MSEVLQAAAESKMAAGTLGRSPSDSRNRALVAMADALVAGTGEILENNAGDVEAAQGSDLSSALVDRLKLDAGRVRAMAEGLRAVAAQPDPVGELIGEWTRPNGLRIQKVRVPLGVVAVIYEARPNVTADVAGLCIKSGNCALLRGSAHALRSNRAIVELLVKGLSEGGLPQTAVRLVEDVRREAALELMQARGLVDLLIPRGGPSLIDTIERNATVPYIIDGDGNCHVYVDRAADPAKATAIVLNAKTQRPGVCNAAETLLVHADLSEIWLPSALAALSEAGVEIRGDERVCRLWPDARPAREEDWATEYLDLILAVRVVDSLDEAVAHVNRWGTSNAEAIVTQDAGAARRFTEEVDSGTVFVNASTRFSDGGEFGFGSEIGISTQKLHARGPMGARELTTYRYVVWGDGQVRT